MVSQSIADIAAIERILEPICQAQGVALVDVRHRGEPGGAVLQVLIEPEAAVEHPDSQLSVTLSDCTQVSRALGALLDERENLVPGNYRLEVSSPGVERPLIKLRDYKRYVGREIKLQTLTPIDGRKRHAGVLLGAPQEHTVQIEVDGEPIDIPLNEISKAHLVHRF